jgi:galactokinase
VALSLEAAGYRLRGADLLIDSDIPIGAGLSSSAALEVSASSALASLSGHEIDGMRLARIGQAAEHKYAGVLSGIMDQFASVFGREGHALFLDCRSFEWSAVPVSSAEFVICNTKVKHDLAESEYNKRRAECLAAAEFFGKTSLRDVLREEIEERWDEMPQTLRQRARHVVSENKRVIDVVEALKRDDPVAVGRWINESHESLRDCYEVSSRELDIMVDIARMQAGVIGARMMGGGFGGCTINLVRGGLSPDDRYRTRDLPLPDIGRRGRTPMWLKSSEILVRPIISQAVLNYLPFISKLDILLF